MRTLFPLAAVLLVACTGGAPATTNPAGGGSASQPTTAAGGHDMAGHGDMADAAAFKPLEGAKVMFTEPADGATVTSPVKVVMGVEGAEVKPAGALVAGTGHHHVIVDGQPVEQGEVVPKDDTHIHFGDGSTETELELAPGEHTLTLQFADGMHRSYGRALSKTITITVGE